MVHKNPKPSAGPGGGLNVTGARSGGPQEGAPARDGVSRPAGGENPAARGFPGSRHPAKVKGPNRDLDGIDYPGPGLARGHG